MLTGDNKRNCSKIASALNIEFRAELKPEDKAEIVKSTKESRRAFHW